MSTTCAALLILCLSAVHAADTLTFSYHELNRGVASTADFAVVREGQGYHISICSTKGNERIRQTMDCDASFATRQWRYQSDQKTDLSFRRDDDRIEITGAWRGAEVRKRLRIDAHPWYQVVPLGLQSIARDSACPSRYWAVSLDEPAVLKAACFCVAAIVDTSAPGRPETACRRLRVRIEGLPARIWVGDYFMRRDDNTFVRYQGYLYGSKKPSGTIEVVMR